MMTSRFAMPPLRRRIFRRRYLLGRPLPQPARPHPTIRTSAQRTSPFFRVRVRYPDWVIRGDAPPPYDLAMATELLAGSDEFPDDPGDMFVLLTEYRYALEALVDAGRKKQSSPPAHQAGA
jgi:hypothetical protein